MASEGRMGCPDPTDLFDTLIAQRSTYVTTPTYKAHTNKNFRKKAI